MSLNQLRRASYTLCWAAKWHGERKIDFGAIWDDKGQYINRIHSLVNEADAIITYNGDKFDLPILNKDFLLEGLGPPAPYKSIDVYKTVSRVFKFPSNKLMYVTDVLNVTRKMEHEGHGLWTKVMDGNVTAQRKMTKYCKTDVIGLEEVYDQVRPWIKGHPTVTLYDMGEGGCPRCGESETLVKEGFAYTLTGKYQRYKCNHCHSWSQSTKRTEGVYVKGV